MRMPPRLGALIAIIFWGMSFVATKAALREISPVTLIFVRFAIGVVLLFAIVRSWPPRQAWPMLALMGFVGIFVHQIIQSYALTMTSAVHTGWLIGVTPIWSAILSAIILRERLGWMKTAGLAGGFIGAILVLTHGDFSANILALPSTKGDLLILISTVNWAVYSTMGHGTIRAVGPQRATAGAMLCGTVMLAPLFIARSGWQELPHLSSTGWLAVAFLGIGCSGLGYLFWYGAVEKIELSRVAAFLYFEPIVTFVTALLLLHETVNAVTVIGGAIVLGSVVVVQYAHD